MEGYISLIILGVIVYGAIFAALCVNLANKKGYDETGGYGAAGFFFGVLALIYVSGLPDIQLKNMIKNLEKNIFQKNTNIDASQPSKTEKSNAILSDELPPL